ncbi:MAG: Lrp/AsnC family transcriptional regulator [Candidatus Helarchaeota archaeon]
MKLDKLDLKNKMLIHLLQENGRDSLTSLGKQLNLSHVSVQKRLKKLIEADDIQITANLNSSNLGLHYAVILAEVDSYDQLKKLMEKFNKCRRLVFFGTMTGAYNVISIVAAETQEVLQSVINVCSMRNEPGLRRSDVFIVDIPLRPKFVPYDIPIGNDNEKSPCGMNCGTCERYIENKCLGCPSTRWYRT